MLRWAAAARGRRRRRWLTVPFPVLPGRTRRSTSLRDFTPAQLAREQAFHQALRPPAYLSLAASACSSPAVLGLTRLGARLVGAAAGPWTVQAVSATAVLLLLGSAGRRCRSTCVASGCCGATGCPPRTWGSAGPTTGSGRSASAPSVRRSWRSSSVLALARGCPAPLVGGGPPRPRRSLIVVGSFLYPVVVEPAFNRFTSLPAGAAAHRPAGDGRPGRCARRGRPGRRRVPPDDLAERLRQRLRRAAADRRLRHAAAQADPARGRARRGARAGPRQARRTCCTGRSSARSVRRAAVCALSLLLRLDRRCCAGSVPRAGRPAGAAAGAVPRGGGARCWSRPLTNLVSRHVEARADVHSLDLTGDVDTFVAGEQRLSMTNLSDLDPGRWSTRCSSPTRAGRSGSRWPASGSGCTGEDAGRHQRLPASPRRHPGLRARPWSGGSRRGGGRLRLVLDGAQPRSTPAQPFPVVREPHVACCCPTPGRRCVGPCGRREPRAATGSGSARPRRSG